MKIAVVGAPGTGKSSLIESLKKVLPRDHWLVDAPALTGTVGHDADFTLLMGLDLPLASDQTSPDSSPNRDQADACLRATLTGQGLRFAVVYGRGEERTRCALRAIAHQAGQPGLSPPLVGATWQWSCEKCSDGSCEHRIFTGLLKSRAADQASTAGQ